MVYDCRIDNLIAALAAHVPTQKLKQIVQKHRTSELGLLSVGFKLHCLELMPRLDELMVKLWRETTDHKNLYLKEGAVQCWVFPPVGNANTAIAILETIEKAAGIEIFDNPKIQIQVCSPGRLSPKAAAYLTIGVCLGSDVLKDYRFEDLETSFSKARQFYTNNMASEKPRWGRRLALYDAGGFLDTKFVWWREAHGQLEIDLQLPFELGRTDILSASTRCDIKNVNLIATLILHEELEGFWSDLGRQLRQDIDKLLQDHQLSGLLNASWIADGTKANANDWEYFQALRELTFYTLSENERIRRTAQIGNSILFGIHDLLDTYRTEMKVQSAEAFGRK